MHGPGGLLLGPRHRRLVLREHDHRRPPVREAFPPQQIGRLQMPELDELRQLELAQGAELLAIAGEEPLRLCWR
jgi:hypothetical protein